MMLRFAGRYSGHQCCLPFSCDTRLRKVLLIDPLPPLSLTSDKSTECYRNWWPGPGDAMVKLMNRSISRWKARQGKRHLFHLNRRGYLYVTIKQDNLDTFIRMQRTCYSRRRWFKSSRKNNLKQRLFSSQPTGFEGYPDGADLSSVMTSSINTIRS